MKSLFAKFITGSLLGLALGGFAAAQTPSPDDGVPETAGDETALRPEPKRRPINGIAAKVNGEVITRNQIMIQVAPLQSVLMSRFPRRGPNYEAQLSKTKKLITNELIDRAIIFSEYKERISAITDQQIEEEVKRVIDRQYNGDESQFRKYLAAAHVTRDQFKQQQRREILVQIVRQQHLGDVPNPTGKELREEYDEWKISNRDRSKDVATYRRIYLRKDLDGGPTAQLLRAERLMKKLQDGEDFAALAKAHSNDSHAEDGGLWKDIPRPDLNMEFAFILFDDEETEENKIMGPLEEQFGFNIIKILERKFGESPPFEKVRDQIKRRVIGKKKNANFEEWMVKMRNRSIVDVEPEFRSDRWERKADN